VKRAARSIVHDCLTIFKLQDWREASHEITANFDSKLEEILKQRQETPENY
jgi:hypothetical protein